MADVIDVVHKITYQVDDEALVNATSIIQHQLIELSEINKSIGVLQQQLQKVSASEVALIRQISDKTDKLFARLEANAGRTKGVLEQVGRGLLVGLGGTNGLESTVSRIIAPLATKLPEAALKGGSSILELGGKLLSFGNIVTASISILSTLTLEFLNSQKSVEGISAELAEAQEVLADFAQTASEDIGKFRSLYAVITDVNTRIVKRNRQLMN